MKVLRHFKTLEITKPTAKPFIVNSWYRPCTEQLARMPKYTYENLIIQMHDSENKEVILIGDFIIIII